MKYYLTKHSKQRRPNYDITPDNVLIDMLDNINRYIHFDTLKNGKYKISYNRFFCVFSISNKGLTLITTRGYYNLNDFVDKLVCHESDIIIPKNKCKKDGKCTVLRKNELGKFDTVGYVIKVYGTNEKRMVLNKRLSHNLIMPKFNKAGMKFINNKDIIDYASYDLNNDVYILNKFEIQQ